MFFDLLLDVAFNLSNTFMQSSKKTLIESIPCCTGNILLFIYVHIGTVVQKISETPLFISIQIIIQKGNWYHSSWIIVYFNTML